MCKKIGEVISFNENIEIKSIIEDGFISVKCEDKGVIDNNGDITMLSGQAIGKRINSEINVKGYDYNNIAELLFDSINTETIGNINKNKTVCNFINLLQTVLK